MILRAWPWLLAVALIAYGQERQPPKKDPQAAIEPRSAPGAGQRFLEGFVGDWTVTKTFYPRQGDPVSAKGECTQTMIHGGRFLKSEFEFDSPTGKTTGTGIIGFESNPGLFTSTWIDSRSTRISLRRSKDRFDGKKIILFSRSLEEMEARASYTHTWIEDEGRKIVHRQFSPAPDGKDRLVMELVMTRKGGMKK